MSTKINWENLTKYAFWLGPGGPTDKTNKVMLRLVCKMNQLEGDSRPTAFFVLPLPLLYYLLFWNTLIMKDNLLRKVKAEYGTYVLST